MLKFDQYQEVDQSFQTSFGSWCKKYPYLAALAEAKLREEFDRKNGRRLNEIKKPIRQYLPTYGRWKSTVYRATLKLSLNRSNPKNKARPSVFFMWGKEVADSITSSMNSAELVLNRGDSVGMRAYRGAGIRLQTATMASARIWRYYKKIYNFLEKSLDVDRMFDDPLIMERLIAKEVDEIATIIDKTNTKYIVLGSDQSPFFRVLCLAASQVGAKTAVIGHGYFQSSHLGGVLPVYADRLFVWTRLQQQEIWEVIKDEDKQKIVWEGFPYPVGRAQTTSKTVLVALDWVPLDESVPGWWDNLELLVRKLQEDGWQAIVRPKDDADIKALQAHLVNTSIICRKIDLYEEFDSVTAVIGGCSSVIVQASYYGLKTCRVFEWTTDRDFGEGIERVKIAEIPGYIRENNSLARKSPDKFVELTLDKIVQVLDEV